MTQHTHIHPARVWSMNSRQEIALKQVWAALLKSFGYDVKFTIDEIASGYGMVSLVGKRLSQESVALTISLSKETTSLSSSTLSFIFQLLSNKIKTVFYLLETGGYDDDSAEVFSLSRLENHPLLAKYIAEDLHKSLWALGRNDGIDNYLLRFMRLTDFDFKSSLKWIAQALDWRINSANVEDLLSKGDAHFYFEGNNPKLVEAFVRNEVYIRGELRLGAPLCFIRARRHLRKNCPDDDYQRLIVLLFEWCRLRLLEFKHGIDQCQVVFDLTGFTLKNADFHAVKFAVRAFQKYYPDCVEKIYIHNAPRVFSIMWNIVVKWLKPHLKEKVVFTRTYDELQKFIDPKYIPKHLGGQDKTEPPYIEPTSYNCQRKEPDALFGNLMKQRDELTVRFIEATIKWLEATSAEESKTHLDVKIRLAKAKAQNYVYLDPYLRARGVPDRNGEIPSLSY